MLALVKEDINEKPTRSGPTSRRPFRGRGDGGRGGKIESNNKSLNNNSLFIVFYINRTRWSRWRIKR